MTVRHLHHTMFQSLLDLASDEGILASGRDEVYGCVFGRDSAITVLKILKVYREWRDERLLEISRKALLKLIELQGRDVNIESGEEPGKFIHEYRADKYERLLSMAKPWYLYPDNIIRNYDSCDSTPLGLIALYRYFEVTDDFGFVKKVLPAVRRGLDWIMKYGDCDGDYLIEFAFHTERQFGGLAVQSWTDSDDSFRTRDRSFPRYPIAPVEVQAFSWLALHVWADFYQTRDPFYSRTLRSFAGRMKVEFNKKFILEDRGRYFAAQGLDGHKNQIKTVTANPILCLWAAHKTGNRFESIFKRELIPDIVQRSFMRDMFVSGAGVRTMSSLALTFNPKQDSYHNGSFWPMLNGLIYEGLLNFGYLKEAKKLKTSSLKPIRHFGCAIELYIHDREAGYLEYQSPDGQVSCRNQAWSAAAILHMVVSS